MSSDLNWPEGKPIGHALEDIEEKSWVPVALTPDFLKHLYHMEKHGFERIDLEEKK